MRSPLKTILASGFIAGTLDMLTAIVVYCFLLKRLTPGQLLRSIASGVFKQKANLPGIEMPLYGLLFHYCIAFSFAILYFLLFPYVPFLKKQKIISGILYGAFVWLVMNLGVLPLVFGRSMPTTFEFIAVGMLILMLMIGLPVSLITHKYYSSEFKKSA